MWYLRAALLVLVVAWNANVEALPVHHSEHGNLGDAAEVAQVPVTVNPPIANAPDTPALQRASAKTANAELAVAQARAAVDGPPAPVAQPKGVQLPVAEDQTDPNAVKNAQPMTVGTPEMDPNSLDMNPEQIYVRPPLPEHINRDLNPGDYGFVKQQAERPIYTADHEIHHIDIKLQKQRDLKYYVARGSKDVLIAAEKGSHATAEMANAVREQEEQDVALSEAKIRNIKAEILAHQGKNNKEHAQLQLKLVAEEKKHAKLLATAKTMGEAVNTAIDKAGDIEGRARAQYHQDMDPQMELSEAIVEAARAKMALEEHDKQVAEENRQAEADKKKRDYFRKVQKDGERALDAIKDQGKQYADQQEEKDYKEDIAAANKAENAAMSVGTVSASSVEATPPQPPWQQQGKGNPYQQNQQSYQQPYQQYQQPSQPTMKPPSTDDLAAQAKAASDFARQNPSPENAKAAADAIRAYKNAPQESPEEKIEKEVKKETEESNTIAGMATNPGTFRI